MQDFLLTDYLKEGFGPVPEEGQELCCVYSYTGATCQVLNANGLENLSESLMFVSKRTIFLVQHKP